MDTWINGYMAGWMDGWMDRQLDKLKNVLILSSFFKKLKLNNQIYIL